MLQPRHATVFALMFVVTLSAVPSTVRQPFAPSTGTDVLRAMHDRYASTWYSTISFTERADQRTANGTIKSEKWYEEAKLPGLLRIDVGVPASDKVTKRKTMLFANGNLYLRVPGQPLRKTANLNLLLVLGFDVYREPVEQTVAELKAEGFDLSRVHKSIWRGRPVYVVGAAAGDLKSKQFWIDAQRLLFVRLIEPSPTSGSQTTEAQTTEALFDGYQRLAGGWIATIVNMNKNGVMQLHEKYADIRANVDLPDAWFDPASLR